MVDRLLEDEGQVCQGCGWSFDHPAHLQFDHIHRAL